MTGFIYLFLGCNTDIYLSRPGARQERPVAGIVVADAAVGQHGGGTDLAGRALCPVLGPGAGSLPYSRVGLSCYLLSLMCRLSVFEQLTAISLDARYVQFLVQVRGRVLFSFIAHV